jgi:hypothetical protein
MVLDMTRRLIVDLDENVHKMLKVQCAVDGVTIADVIRSLIDEYLKRTAKKKDKENSQIKRA